MAAGNGRRNGLAIVFSPSLRTGTFLRTLPPLRRAPRLRDQIRGVLAGFRILGGGSLGEVARPAVPPQVCACPSSRHARPAAPPPPSLPALTVPRRYASAGRLAGRGASTLSVHGLFRNGSLEAGGSLNATRPGARSLPVPLDAISSLRRDTPPTLLPTTSRSGPPPPGNPR